MENEERLNNQHDKKEQLTETNYEYGKIAEVDLKQTLHNEVVLITQL